MTIPDTINGPLYQAWVRLRNIEIERDLAAGRAHRQMMGIPWTPTRSSDGTRLPRTATEAVRQVINDKLNGHPVTRDDIRREAEKLFPMTDTNFNSAIGDAHRLGLIGRAERYGMWQKIKPSERKMAQ